MGCAGGKAKGSGAAAPDDDRATEPATSTAVLEDARALASTLGVPEGKRDSLLSRLERVLTEPSYHQGASRAIARLGITGVVAYRIGEGGALVTAKGGRILVRMEGADHAFRVRGTDFGPRVDATREWGVGLLLGLRDPGAIAGIYEGLRESAAVVAGAGRAMLKARGATHELVLLGRSSGASFGAGSSKLTLVAVDGS